MAGGRDGRRRRAAARSRPICPVIAGPTAVGKTDLITDLAARHPIEVISLDSRQIYQGLRIGTAQPTPGEQAACRHHLVDFLSPDLQYSAQRFRDDFSACWREITARGKLPVLVGGAGLYLKAVEEGFFSLPAEARDRLPDVRRAVAALDDDALERELLAADQVSATRLHRNDRYRRQRALEVCRLAGRPFSELTAEQRPQPACGLAFPLVLLDRPMGELDGRIAARTHVMLDEGWVAETEALLARHDPAGPGLNSIGYAEIVQHLQGRLGAGDLPATIARATRQYARRQRTWFRPRAREAVGTPDAREVSDASDRLIGRALQALGG